VAPRATGRNGTAAEQHRRGDTCHRTGDHLKRLRDAAHARGSAEAMREYVNAISFAMILSHAERLASLVEGTPAYAQCVELTARDVEN
jgi:hypothetical protein